ncbi:MAG: hypothetical protein K0U78_02530 [Actinomycetia bacterium]|nr:hypothetical protein [Actinomycetes bacterium]
MTDAPRTPQRPANKIFGDALPEIGPDERENVSPDDDDDNDQRLKENRPPHH